MNSTSKRPLLLFPVLLLCLFSACTQNTADKKDQKYALYIMAKDNKEYIVETSNLDSGLILPEKAGAEVNQKLIDRSVIVKDGHYYHYDRKAAAFVKYRIEDKSFKALGSVPLTKFSIENYRWLGGDTLLLTGLDVPGFAQVKYILMTTGNMKTVAEGPMPIPLPTGRFDNMSVGFVQPQNGKLLVGYTYHQELGKYDYTTSDTAYISTLTYPQMKLISTDKDWRSTYPGGINTVQSSSFSDEAQNYYFMDCPGIALGNRPELPTAILKINKGTNTPDPSYFFDFSALVGNHAYGMWYLGNDQALVRSERKDLFKGLNDHYSTAHFEFYIIDLKQKTMIKKLNLPLDKGTRRECLIVKDGIAYISTNSVTEGNFIWSYNIKSGALKKGLQLSGSTDFILKIDKLR